jgi:hypothetical protein
MVILWLGVLILAAVGSGVLVVWFERRYRGEIRRRDGQIEALVRMAHNNEVYIQELQLRCERLRWEARICSDFHEYQMEQDEAAGQYRIYLN